MEIILASNNDGKIKEIKNILKNEEVKSLNEIKFYEDIDEFGVTFFQNALIKAERIVQEYPESIIISDDSGLCVEALDGGPGIYTKRYAQGEKNYSENYSLANNEKLLKELKNKTNRKAYYITVLCLIIPGEVPQFFAGKLHGKIAEKMSGTEGFGYDPIFIPDKKGNLTNNNFLTLAEFTNEEKNAISHRGKALEELKNFLKN